MRGRWANWSLRVQLSLAVTLIMGLLLVVFSAVLFVAVRSFVLNQTAEQLRVRAQVLLGDKANVPSFANDQLWTRLPTAPLEDTQRAELEPIVDVLTTEDTSVVVYQPDGQVALRGAAETRRDRPNGHFGPWKPRSAPLAPPSLDHWAWERVLRGDQEVRFTGSSSFERQLAVLVPVYDDSNLVGVVQVATPLRQTNALLRWLAALLVGGTFIVALTALLLSLWATHTILNPLRRIVGVSQRVGQGDLGARTELRSRNEIGALGATFDQMLAYLQTAFATQRRFIADAAHELRTPLTAVSGNLELLMLGAVSEPAQQRRSLQRMNSELERMSRLVDDLLTLSRLDAQPTLRHAPVDLGALAHEIVGEFRGLSPDHHWSLAVAPNVSVKGDADRLRQVLLNIVENARKYTPTGGISITVTSRQGAGVVTVTDTGVGIPPDDVPHVWERFYRVDQARTRTSGGSGLGLAIVKSIVEAHHGQVTLSSTVGQGTTVTVTLPLAHEPITKQTPKTVD